MTEHDWVVENVDRGTVHKNINSSAAELWAVLIAWRGDQALITTPDGQELDWPPQ